MEASGNITQLFEEDRKKKAARLVACIYWISDYEFAIWVRIERSFAYKAYEVASHAAKYLEFELWDLYRDHGREDDCRVHVRRMLGDLTGKQHTYVHAQFPAFVPISLAVKGVTIPSFIEKNVLNSLKHYRESQYSKIFLLQTRIAPAAL